MFPFTLLLTIKKWSCLVCWQERKMSWRATCSVAHRRSLWYHHCCLYATYNYKHVVNMSSRDMFCCVAKVAAINVPILSLKIHIREKQEKMSKIFSLACYAIVPAEVFCDREACTGRTHDALQDPVVGRIGDTLSPSPTPLDACGVSFWAPWPSSSPILTTNRRYRCHQKNIKKRCTQGRVWIPDPNPRWPEIF